MNNHPDDPDATYLPERYRKQVKAKKQRRIYKKMIAAGLVIGVIFIAIILISGMIPAPQSNPSPDIILTPTTTPTLSGENPVPLMNITVAVTPGFTTGTGISTLYTSTMLPLLDAVSLLREEYPAETFTLVSANLTDRYSGLMLYEFTIQSLDNNSPGIPFKVFNNAVNGDPYAPGQENARITPLQAQELAKKSNPTLQPDRVIVRFLDSAESGTIWNFTLVKGTSQVVTGSMEAETGRIISFVRTIQKLGRPAEPVIDQSTAQGIADRYISGQNGPVAVNASVGRYFPLGYPSDPIAGQYLFIFNRMVNEIPCDAEGFVVGVDSVNSEIIRYERRWSASDSAFSISSEPLVLKREATFAVLQRAKETSPESVDGLRILSADLRWKDLYSPGIIPRPGSIPLAWKVTFDDNIIQANRSAQPATAWVDAQTGAILDFVYQH